MSERSIQNYCGEMFHSILVLNYVSGGGRLCARQTGIGWFWTQRINHSQLRAAGRLHLNIAPYGIITFGLCYMLWKGLFCSRVLRRSLWKWHRDRYTLSPVSCSFTTLYLHVIWNMITVTLSACRLHNRCVTLSMQRKFKNHQWSIRLLLIFALNKD